MPPIDSPSRAAVALAGALVLASPCAGADAAAVDRDAWQGLTAEDLAEVFHPASLYRGVRTSREECAAKKLAVWVEHKYGEECVRYYPSRDVAGARRAAFYFHGDLFLDGDVPAPSASVDNSVGAKLKEAQNLAGVNLVPFVVMARPGALGSSGEHRARRRPKEFYSLNAAVDAIKARYGIEEVILTGQSGGATAVGALLTLGRSDVVCAAASSGGFDVLGRADLIWKTTGKGRRGCDTTLYCDPYNVIDFVGQVKPDPRRRIFIIGDPRDKTTPFVMQRAFAEKLSAAGHAVLVVEGQAVGAEHHRLAHMATRTAGWCNAGLPSEEIVAKIRADEYGLKDARRKRPGDERSTGEPPE